MDRNRNHSLNLPSSPVALRKESVDRNVRWPFQRTSKCVALRKESVDRNKYVVQCRKTLGVSLSARRAWIEIFWCLCLAPPSAVALRKESVDRNKEAIKIVGGM